MTSAHSPEVTGMLIATRTNQLSIGVDLLDTDHRRFDESIKELNSQIAIGWNRSQIGDLLNGLATSTLLHFALEEGMMEATRYPMLARHRYHHRLLIREMDRAVLGFLEKGQIPGVQWLNLISSSTGSHVHSDDLRFGEWLVRN